MTTYFTFANLYQAYIDCRKRKRRRYFGAVVNWLACHYVRNGAFSPDDLDTWASIGQSGFTNFLIDYLSPLNSLVGGPPLPPDVPDYQVTPAVLLAICLEKYADPERAEQMAAVLWRQYSQNDQWSLPHNSAVVKDAISRERCWWNI